MTLKSNARFNEQPIVIILVAFCVFSVQAIPAFAILYGYPGYSLWALIPAGLLALIWFRG